MKYPFRFKVQIFDSDERTYYISNGLGLCTSYANAAKQIETHFQENLCTILNITLFQDDNLIFLPEETCNTYEKTVFPEIEYAYKCNTEGAPI